jgi:hypothetical protein
MESMVEEGPTVFRIGIRLMGGTGIAEPGRVWGRVEKIFTQFCRGVRGQPASPFVRAVASWMVDPVDPASLKPHEMLVYLVKDTSKSLIRHHYPQEWAKNPPDQNVIGLTAVKQSASGNLSEVYYAHPFLKDEPERIANTIIHELMHNKLNMDDDMHDLAPAIGPEGGFLQAFQPVVSSAWMGGQLQPTVRDIRTMTPVLSRTVKQKAGI